MSPPYHIGNGWFGGFLPTTELAMVALTGDIYYGLWYPIIIALMTVVIGTFFTPETKDVDVSKKRSPAAAAHAVAAFRCGMRPRHPRFPGDSLLAGSCAECIGPVGPPALG